VAFDFAMSRASQWPTRFLARFSGTLVVDGYAGYSEVLRRLPAAVKRCLDATYAKSPSKSVIRNASAYSIHRGPALTRYLDARWLHTDNNPVENATGRIALGKKTGCLSETSRADGARRSPTRSLSPRS